MGELLTVENLHVSFGNTVAVRGVSLAVHAGEILALVGESGSGKSVTAQSILRLNPTAQTSADRLMLAGQDLLTASEKELDSLRGRVAGMVFQDPMTCLNPTMRVGEQITEGLFRKEGLSRAQCQKEAVRLLEQVQMPDAALRARQYPHQLSGGMRQRVMIAMAIACRPRLLIADEPTTALDVTTQLQILRLIAKIRRETGAAVLLITHDLGVVANLADRVAVMHAGRIVEESGVQTLFEKAQHPYTKALLSDLNADGEPLAFPVQENTDTPAQGCPFAGRCRDCMHICLRREPSLLPVESGQFAACWQLHDHTPKEDTNGETA